MRVATFTSSVPWLALSGLLSYCNIVGIRFLATAEQRQAPDSQTLQGSQDSIGGQ